MEHTIGGVSLRLEIIGAHPTNAALVVNGCSLIAPATWAAINALVGSTIPGSGEIMAVGAPRMRGDLPIGARINLVTAVS